MTASTQAAGVSKARYMKQYEQRANEKAREYAKPPGEWSMSVALTRIVALRTLGRDLILAWSAWARAERALRAAQTRATRLRDFKAAEKAIRNWRLSRAERERALSCYHGFGGYHGFEC